MAFQSEFTPNWVQGLDLLLLADSSGIPCGVQRIPFRVEWTLKTNRRGWDRRDGNMEVLLRDADLALCNLLTPDERLDQGLVRLMLDRSPRSHWPGQVRNNTFSAEILLPLPPNADVDDIYKARRGKPGERRPEKVLTIDPP